MLREWERGGGTRRAAERNSEEEKRCDIQSKFESQNTLQYLLPIT